MISYWQQTAWFNHTDVAVIGGGIVGLSAAIQLKLKEPALRVSLFEKGVIPAGASTRNAGFATFGSVSELADDLAKHPAEKVYALARKRYEGLNLLRKMIGDEAMLYEACGGYEIFKTNEEFEKYATLVPEMNLALQEFSGLTDTFIIPSQTAESFGFNHTAPDLIFNRHEGAIHSGKMIQALMEKARGLGVQLFYGFEVNSILPTENGTTIHFQSGFSLPTKAVLVCTNGFSTPFFPDLDLKPARGLILVTEPIPDLKIKGTFHHNKGYDYFREVDGRVLLGGGRNLDVEGETSTDNTINSVIYDYLVSLLYTTILPYAHPKIEYTWTGTMGIGEAKNPIIQQYQPHVFCAIRMGGMGVALGSQTGADAAQLVIDNL